MGTVIDANIALSWYLGQGDTDAARELLKTESELIAPQSLLHEFCGSLARLHRRMPGVYPAPSIMWAMDELLESPVEFVPLELYVKDALRIAVNAPVSGHDAAYVALAVLSGGVLVTQDGRLVESAHVHGYGKYVRLLGNE